jgi:hypothetical protein
MTELALNYCNYIKECYSQYQHSMILLTYENSPKGNLVQ